jgi:cyclic beta-1,2-glucan synthetase
VPNAATRSGSLKERLEASAWDGEWYRRAWFDDGTPLGSRDSDECRIDSHRAELVGAVRGGGRRARTQQAMASLAARLVRTRRRWCSC